MQNDKRHHTSQWSLGYADNHYPGVSCVPVAPSHPHHGIATSTIKLLCSILYAG